MMASRNTWTRRFLLASVIAMAMPGSAGAAPAPKLAVLVASQGKDPSDDALLIIDPVAKAVVARVKLSGAPHNITMSSDGKFAYTSNPGANANNFHSGSEVLTKDSISIVDVAARKEVRVVKVGPGANPHGIQFAAGKVYYTAEGSRTVGRYDPKKDIVDWIGGVGQNRVHELVVTRDGSKILTANIGSDNVAMLASWDPKVDVLTAGSSPPPWNVTIIPAGHGIEAIVITPDEREAWVLNGDDASISVIDVAMRKVVETIALKTRHPQRLAISADGKLALVPSETGELLILDTKSRKVIKSIPNVGTESHGVVVSQDNAVAYVAALGESEVAVVDLKTFTVTARIPTGTARKGDRIEGIALAYLP